MSGKSKEEIAFEILAKLKGVGIWGENNQEDILDMYANCLEATSGLREVDGRTPIALRLAPETTAAKPAVAPVVKAPVAPSVAPQAPRAPHPAQNQVPPAFQAAPPQQQAPQAAPAHATPAQQQQRVQQAYQQQVQQPR